MLKVDLTVSLQSPVNGKGKILVLHIDPEDNLIQMTWTLTDLTFNFPHFTKKKKTQNRLK